MYAFIRLVFDWTRDKEKEDLVTNLYQKRNENLKFKF